jgi:hypothetical protein
MPYTELGSLFKGKEGTPVEIRRKGETNYHLGIYVRQKERLFTFAWRHPDFEERIVGVHAQLDDGVSIVKDLGTIIQINYFSARGKLDLTPDENNKYLGRLSKIVSLLRPNEYGVLDQMLTAVGR